MIKQMNKAFYPLIIGTSIMIIDMASKGEIVRMFAVIFIGASIAMILDQITSKKENK